VIVDPTAQFEELRPALFLLAYRMLGTRSDAEDVVQEAYLRWLDATETDIRLPKAYLTTVVARLSLDALKSARRKREVYVGPWLPEPIVEPFGAQRLEMAESISIAFLHVLELLSPTERIAFLLREVFDASYAELAQALDVTEENSRQIVTRARRRIQAKRPRFTVDHDLHRHILQKFLMACASGNQAQLTELLRHDAVMYSDGGGKTKTALNPIVGADHIARFFIGLERKGLLGNIRTEFAAVNGQPGVLLFVNDHLESIVSLALNEEYKIATIFLVVNPDKLHSNAPGILHESFGALPPLNLPK